MRFFYKEYRDDFAGVLWKPEEGRKELQEMLAHLPDGSLELVWRSIVYTYCLTEGNAPDCLTDEDHCRNALLEMANCVPLEQVSKLVEWGNEMFFEESA